MKRTIELKMRFVVNWTLRHYHSDLKHDFAFIQTCDPDRFIWITHECGTHFARFWKSEELPESGKSIPYLFGTATREQIVDNELGALRDCFNEAVHDFYLIEPKIGTFRKIRQKEAVAMLEEHTENLHKLWQEEKRNVA